MRYNQLKNSALFYSKHSSTDSASHDQGMHENDLSLLGEHHTQDLIPCFIESIAFVSASKANGRRVPFSLVCGLPRGHWLQWKTECWIWWFLMFLTMSPCTCHHFVPKPTSLDYSWNGVLHKYGLTFAPWRKSRVKQQNTYSWWHPCKKPLKKELLCVHGAVCIIWQLNVKENVKKQNDNCFLFSVIGFGMKALQRRKT